jgi:hypothetical protein
MKTILTPLALALVIAVSSPAKVGPGGRVALFSDAGLSKCSLTDSSPQIIDVYVAHITTGSLAESDAASIQFRITSSPGFTGTWLEDIVPTGMSHFGASQSGIGIGYGSCPTAGTILVLHLRYQLQGTSTPCSFLEAGPYPNLCCVATQTCYFFNELPVDGGRLQVNPDQSCPCEATLAIEPSTWGRIKAMYRN